MSTRAAVLMSNYLDERGADVELEYPADEDTNDPVRLRAERDTWRRLASFANQEYAVAQTELGRLRAQLHQHEQRHHLTEDLKAQLAKNQHQLRDLKTAHAAELRALRASHTQALDRANEDVEELVRAQKTRSHRVRDGSSGGLMQAQAELRRHGKMMTVFVLVAQHTSTSCDQVEDARLEQAALLDSTVADLSTARTTIDTLTSQLRSLTTERNVARDTTSALQTTLKNQRDEVRGQTGLLEAELREAVRTYNALKADKTSVEQRLSEEKALLTVGLKSARADLKSARKELAHAHWQTQCVSAEASDLDDDRVALTIALATIGLARPLSAQDNASSSPVGTSNSNQTAQLESAYKRIETLKAYVDSLDARSTGLTTRLVAEQARVARRNEQILAHQREIARLTTNSSLADEALDEMEAMKRDLERVVADADEVRDARDAALRRIDELEERLATVDATGGWTPLLEQRESTHDLGPVMSPTRACSSPAPEDENESFDVPSSPRVLKPAADTSSELSFALTPRPGLIARESSEVALFDFAAAAASVRAPSDLDDIASVEENQVDLGRSYDTSDLRLRGQKSYLTTDGEDDGDAEMADDFAFSKRRSAVVPVGVSRTKRTSMADTTRNMAAQVRQLPTVTSVDESFPTGNVTESNDAPFTLDHGPLVGPSPFKLAAGTPPRRVPAPTPSRWHPDTAPILTPPRRMPFPGPTTSAAPSPSRRAAGTPPIFLLPKPKDSPMAPSPTTDRPRFAFPASPIPLKFAVAASPTPNRAPPAPRFSLSQLPAVTPSPTPRRNMVPGPTPVRGRALGLDEDEDGDGDTPIAARRMGDVAKVNEEVDRTGAVVNLDDTLEFVLSGGRKSARDSAKTGATEESDLGVSVDGSPSSEYTEDLPHDIDELVARIRELEVELAMAREHMVISSADGADASELYDRIIQAGHATGSHKRTVRLDTIHSGLMALARIHTLPTSTAQLTSDLVKTSAELDALRIDYDTLANDHSTLHADCGALISEMHTAEFELDALASEIESLHTQLNTAGVTAERKEGELAEARSAADGLRDRVHELEERREELEAALAEAETAQGENAELHNTVIALEEEVQTLEQELEALQAEVDSGDSEKTALVGVVFALHAELRQTKTLLRNAKAAERPLDYLGLGDMGLGHPGNESNVWTRGELRDKVDLLEQELSDLRDELSSMRERAREADRELSDAKSQLLDARAVALKQELALAARSDLSSSSDPVALEFRISELEGTLTSAQAALAATQEDLAEQRRLGDGLVDKLRAARDVLDNERTANRRKLVQLEIQLDDLTEEREIEKDRAEEALARVSELESKLEDARARIEEQDVEASVLEEVQSELKKARDQLAAKDALAVELGNARARLSDLELQLAAAEKGKADVDRRRVSLDRRVKELVKDVADKDEVERVMRSLQKELAQVSQERDNLDHRSGTLNDQVVTLRQLILDKDSELASLKERLHRAEVTLDDFKSTHEHAIQIQGRMDVIDADLKAKYEECEALDERIVDILKDKRRAEGRAEILSRKVEGLEKLLDEIKRAKSPSSSPILSTPKFDARSPTESMGTITLQPPRRGTGPGPTPLRTTSEPVLSPAPILTRPTSTTPTLARSSSSNSSVRLTRPTTSMEKTNASRQTARSVSRTVARPTEAVRSSTTPPPRASTSLSHNRPTTGSGRVAATSGSRILSTNSRAPAPQSTTVRRSTSPRLEVRPPSSAGSSRASSNVLSRANPRLSAAPPRFPSHVQMPLSPRRPSVEAAAQRTNVRSMAAKITSAQSMPSLSSVVPSSSPSGGRKRSVPEDFDASIVEGALPVSLPVLAPRPRPPSLAGAALSRPITGMPAHRNPSGFTPKRSEPSARPFMPPISPIALKSRALGEDLTNARDEADLRAGALHAMKRGLMNDVRAVTPSSQNAPPRSDSPGPGRVESMRARFLG